MLISLRSLWEQLSAQASGATLAAAASTVSGTATGKAAASGVTLARNATLIPGAATGAAAAAGAILMLADAEIAGSESGNAIASGTTLVVNATIALEGVATVTKARRGSRRVGPALSLPAYVTGRITTTAAGILPGQAAGDANAEPGGLRPLQLRLIDGRAAGRARTKGSAFAARVSLIPGKATGENWATTYDNEFLIAA